MSTDLYKLRVFELQPKERRVRLRVYVSYYDIRVVEGRVSEAWAEPLPRDASFFLRVLWDEPEDWPPDRQAPIAATVTWDEVHDDGWVNANTRRFIERVVQLAARNGPPDEARWLRTYRRYYKGEDDPEWPEELLLVQADYDVWVRDQLWLDQLSVGQVWGTAAFPVEAAGFQSVRSTDGGGWMTVRMASD